MKVKKYFSIEFDEPSLVKLCDYPELQKLWEPVEGDEYYAKSGKGVFFYNPSLTYPLRDLLIWLPQIEDVLKLMDKDDTIQLYPVCATKGRTRKFFFRFTDYDKHISIVANKSARIACLRALKATLKGR